MTSIQSFGTSLLTPQTTQTEKANPPTVEEVLNSTPPAPAQSSDTFEKENGAQNPNKGRGSFWLYLIGGSVFLTGAFFAVRKGWLGERAQKWVGGKLSTSKVYKNIEQKMADYLDVGKKGNVKINKTDDGKSILRAEFSDGSVHEYSVSEGKNLIKIKPINDNRELNAEYITFDRKNGAPATRIKIKKNDDGKVVLAETFKGENILDKNFNEEIGLYKEYKSDAPRREWHLINPFSWFTSKKSVKSTVSVYNNPKTGKPDLFESKTFLKNGKPQQVIQLKPGKERTFHLDDNGRVSSIMTETQDGRIAIEKFRYVPTTGNKVKIEKVEITDATGKPTAYIPWN